MEPESILVIRMSSLGDIIHTLPSYSALRKRFPEAKISWVVEKKGREILELVPGIDEIVVLDSEKARKNPAEIFKIGKKVRKKYQVTLDFQGLIKSGFITFLSRSHRRIGFNKKNLKESLASIFYNESLEEIPEAIHVISKNLKLLTKLGIEEDKYEFPINLPSELVESLNAKLKKAGYEENKKLVVLNVGAGWKTKWWPSQRWAALGKQIMNKDLFLLVLWGTEEEKKAALDVGNQAPVVISPDLSIKEVMALIRISSIVISGDTFALQVACAFSVPVVGIYGPTNPSRNGPFAPGDKVAFHRLPCSFCYKRTCRELTCIERITVEEMVGLVREQLGKNA